MRKNARKSVVKVNPEIASVLRLSQVELIEKISALMKKHKLQKWTFMKIMIEEEKVLICSSFGTIECNMHMTTSRLLQPNVGFTPGKNRTGHRLPASSTCW
jgi:hypothetical protein